MASTPINDQIAGGATEIVLTEDMTENVVIPSGKTISIDLAGFSLSNLIDPLDDSTIDYTITVNGTLVLTDSSEEGTGILDNTNGLGLIKNNGVLTINGVKAFTFSGTAGNYFIVNRKTMTVTDMATTADDIAGYTAFILNGYLSTDDMTGATVCTLTVNGGEYAGSIPFVQNDSFGQLVVTGGEFEVSAGAIFDNRNIANISDGTFTSEGTYIFVTGAYGTLPQCKGEFDIIGGTFEGNKAIQDTTETNDSGHVHTNAHTYVSGGTWTLEDTESLDDFVKPGYLIVLEDGVITFIHEVEWTYPEGGVVGIGFFGYRRAVIHNDSIEYEAGGFDVPVRGFVPTCIIGCMARGGCDAYYNPETKKIQLYRNGTEITERLFDVTIVMIGQ